MRSPEFWQRVLAAELPPAKNRVLMEELGSFVSDPIDLMLKSPVLSDTERKRVRASSMEGLRKSIAGGVSLLEYDDYPELLHEAGAISPALFIKGDVECLYQPTVAIVGTRNASPYGRACAMKFGQALANAGITVVSGGALGIDGSAHKGALDAGGKTVAVLANDVETVYPRVHGALFRQISESGCLVSQFAIGSAMSDYKFLVRNVLIAALSTAVLVIEAPSRSGALRTASAASEFGREVFVVPANIDHAGFQGSFGLLRDGATLVSHPDQILEQLGLAPSASVEVAEASESGEALLAVLSSESLSTELIVAKTGLDPAEVLAELTVLELEGRVIRDANGYSLRP